MNLKKIVALALAASFLFTGCAERREADSRCWRIRKWKTDMMQPLLPWIQS